MTKLEYKNIGHISNILWHFKGPHSPGDLSRPPVIDRLEQYLFPSMGGGFLEPYLGAGRFYERQLLFPPGPLGPPKSSSFIIYGVKEPKAVCFCDITVSHLASHMNKYGDVGLGFHRKALVDKVHDLRPVKYQPIKGEADLAKFNKLDWKLLKRKREITLNDYVKIPTFLETTDRGVNSESFEGIYEEREWRSFRRFEFTVADLAFVVLPQRGLVDRGRHPKLSALLSSGVGVVYATELYGGEK